MKLRRFSMLCLSALLLSACGSGRPSTDNPTRGSISGVVYVTGPVAGAIVSAFAFDAETGELGELIADAEPTAADGSFTVELGNWDGEVLLVARGAAAAYVEPASGANAIFESATVLRAFPVQWDNAAINLHFGFERESDLMSVVISPWSELAVEYADVRRRTFFEPYPEARDEAYRLLHQHLEHDFFAVVPRSLVDADAAAAWDERAQAGMVAAAFSYLARRIAVASSVAPSSLSSLVLLDALKSDLNASGAVLDGAGNAGIIELGNCPDDIEYCAMSGRTFRGGIAEAAALFLFDDDLNQSGFGVNDVRDLLERISWRQSGLFAGPGSPVDGTPPIITITDLMPAEIVNGEKVFTVEVRDAFEVGEVSPLRLTRGTEQAWVEGDADTLFTVTRTETPTLHRLTVTVQSDAITDGDITVEVDAYDRVTLEADGEPTRRSLQVTFDNSPAGTVAGTVTLGGRVAGAEVVIYDHTVGVLGSVLGTATTDATGYYSTEVAESPGTTSLLIVARKPAAGGDASYVEMASGAIVQLSTGDEVEAVIADWVDGENRTVHLTPWTHIAASFARGLWVTLYDSFDFRWDDAVLDAHLLLEEHLDDGSPVDLRRVRPADMTDASQVQTFNAEVRYGLAVAGLGELAVKHADESQATPALMNTLTLTKRLAADLGGEPGEPIFNGRNASGTLAHGDVDATSYWTRIDLAVGMQQFIVTNPRDASTLVESDILTFLDHVSADENPRLYPPAADAPGSLFDLTPPGPLTWEAPTPAADTVLKGSLQLRLRARDDRELASVAWATPGVTNVSLDETAGRANWVLTGNLSLASVVDGSYDIVATATDTAGRESTATRRVVVDTTPPTVVIGTARDGGGTVASGGWTGAAALTSIIGTVSDANGAAAQYRWRGGAWTNLSLSGSSWSVSNLPLAGGANTLEVRATDPANNSRTVSATYHRDATPPVVDIAVPNSSAQVEDENGYVVSVADVGAGRVVYGGVGSGSEVTVTDSASFTKWADRYTAAGPNLPEFRWTLADNRTGPASISAEYRLRRGSTTLADWVSLTGAGGAGYNRSLVVSSDLHPTVGQASGTFQLDVRATDEFGNTSAPFTLSWTQLVKNPALRVGPASSLYLSPSDPRAPGYYNLGSANTNGGPTNNFANLLNGSLPGGKLRVRVWQIDNPNSIPARVRVTPQLGASFKRGLIYGTPKTQDGYPPGWGGNSSCAPFGFGDVLQNGTCWSFPSPGTTESLMNWELLVVGLVWDWVVTRTDGETAVGPCAGCAANEREIPPHDSLLVFGRVNDLAFLDPAYADQYRNVGPVGTQLPVAGVDEATYRHCDTRRIINGNEVCTAYSIRHAVRHITRAKVSFGGTASVESRAGSAGAWSTAPGTPEGQGRSDQILEAESGYSTTW